MAGISTSRVDWKRYTVEGPHGSPLCEFLTIRWPRWSRDLERQADGRLVGVDIDRNETGQRCSRDLPAGEKRPHSLSESSVSEEADWAI